MLQLVIIHGGDTFDTYEEYFADLKAKQFGLERLTQKSWKDGLQGKLGDGFEVLQPRMPNAQNAKYAEWKIWFDKIAQLLNEDVILAGHSLGGIFIAKYLSETHFPKRILGTFLIAAPYDDACSEYSLADFVLPESLTGLEKQGGKIFLYHSEDDPVVAFADMQKYRIELPNAKVRPFKDRQHFNQEEFSELVSDIQGLAHAH